MERVYTWPARERDTYVAAQRCILDRQQFLVLTMAQKRKIPPPKITDFLQASSRRTRSTEHESVEERVGPAPPKRSKHRDSYDPKWEEEFTWLRYVPADQEDGRLFCARFAVNITRPRRKWFSLLFHVSFSARISFASMSDHDATQIRLRLKLWL